MTAIAEYIQAPRANTFAPTPKAKPFAPPARQAASITSLFTSSVWAVCLAVGALGLWLEYSRPTAPLANQPPVTAQLVHVELTNDPLPQPDVARQPLAANAIPTPAPAPAISLPNPPALLQVAAPDAPVAFALPVSAPAQIVDKSAATHSAPSDQVNADPSATAALPVQQLTFGRGEGKQPAPVYPRRALTEGQQGVVKVAFTVAPDGRVAEAALSAPSPWPLLNEAALRAVREKWRFTAGALRRYEAPINFQLRR